MNQKHQSQLTALDFHTRTPFVDQQTHNPRRKARSGTSDRKGQQIVAAVTMRNSPTMNAARKALNDSSPAGNRARININLKVRAPLARVDIISTSKADLMRLG